MLNVIFGRENCNEEFILDTRIYFSENKKPSWFEDEFVKRFLKAVDGSEVLFEEALKDKFGHGISTEMMSTGCKTLCDIYYDTCNQLFNGSAMGNNCVPFLMEIAEKREVRIFLEHYMDIPTEYFERGLIWHNGVCLGEYDYDDAYAEWCASTREMEW